MSDKESMRLPDVHIVRERISSITYDEARHCLMAAYLFGCRISELVGRKTPSDKSVPRGPTGKDVKLVTGYRVGAQLYDVAVFTLATAKRQGKERSIALPLDRTLEPWTEPLLKYYTHAGSNHVFPFTRQVVWLRAHDAFKGLRYPIDRYVITKKGSTKREEIKQHSRDFALHALRHLRTTELVKEYGFDGLDLSIFGGWTMKPMLGVGSSMERYLSLSWQRYFPKLLRPSDAVVHSDVTVSA
jgi:hypothetical protein